MRSNLVKRILAMGLAVVLASSDVLPTFAEELNTTEVVTEEVASIDEEVTSPSNEIIVEGNTAIVPLDELNDFGTDTDTDEEDSDAENTESDKTSTVEDTQELSGTETDLTDIEGDVTDNDVVIVDVTDNDVSDNETAPQEPTTVFDVHEAGVHVIVTISEEGALPLDAELKVSEIEVTPSMEEAVSDALEAPATIKAYDITFYDAEDNEIEPSDKVFVSIFLDEVTEDSAVFHYDEEAEEVEDMEAVAVEGEVAFETDHFSTYLVVNKNVDLEKVTEDITEQSNYVSVSMSLNVNPNAKPENKGLWNDSSFTNDNLYLLKVKVFVDDNLVETFPNNNSEFYNYLDSNASYAVSSVNPKYEIDRIEYGTIEKTNDRTVPDENELPGYWDTETVSANKYDDFSPFFSSYKYEGWYNDYYRYNYVCIYLETKPTTDLGNEYVKVTAKNDYYKVSKTGGYNRYLTINTYVSDTDEVSDIVTKTDIFKLSGWNKLNDTLAFSDIMDGYEIKSVKFDGNEKTLTNNSVKLTGSDYKWTDVLDIYLTASGYYNDDSNVRVTLAKYDPEKINVNGTVSRDFIFNKETDGNEPLWNRWFQAENEIVYTGIVKKNLNSNGFPVLAVGNSRNKDLDYLFSRKTSGVTQLITGASGLLGEPDQDGYYIFDSDDASKRLVYTAEKYTNRFENAENGFFAPFSAKSNDDSDKFFFGMKIETEFLQPASGKINGKPMQFEFSGDDDVWVFIDGNLVLDMGGLHSALGGSIDFSTGVVTRPDKSRSETGTIAPTTLRELYEEAYREENPNADDEDVNAWLYGAFDDGNTFKDFSAHSLTMYYFERGGNQSNCVVKFNLPTISKDSTVAVSKKVTGKKEEDNKKYSFLLDYIDNNKQDESFELENGETKEFVIPEGTKFTVKETDVDAAAVKIDGTISSIDVKSKTVVSTTYEASDVFKSIVFDNIYEGQYGDTVVTKTATCEDYDNRTYAINLSADYNGTKTVVSETTTQSDADVVLVLDTSGSMIYTDVAVINTGNSKEAYSSLNVLDKSKIYFTSTRSTYNKYKGIKVSGNVKSRLLSTAFESDNSMTCYNTPSSGEYLFYSNESWYKRSVNDITKDNALNTSKATKINHENCPKTIYTNRSEVMINAAKSFVDNLTAGSRVAVVKFGDSDLKNALLCGFTSNKDEVKRNLNSAAGVYSTATYPLIGLDQAFKLFDADSNENANYTVFFTDGANDGNSIVDIAEDLKAKSQVYAIGIGNNGSTLTTVATDSNHILSAQGAESLGELFSSVSSSIVAETTSFTGKGTVIDYIDPRFEVVDPGSGKLETDDNGNKYIKWENVEIGHDDKKWGATITVRAKDNFFGGNAIPTNGAGSKVSIDGETPVNFPQPTVNVKELDYLFDYEVADFETTLLLGEESQATEYVKVINDSVKGKGLDKKVAEDITDLVKLSDEEIETLISNYNSESESNSLVKDYTVNGEAIGSFTYTLIANDKDAKTLTKVENHESDAVAKPYETYTIKIDYVPLTEAERLTANPNFVAPTNGGAAVESIERHGTYTVNVTFEGKITLVKKINTSEIEWTDGDPIFTFKITNMETGKSVYKTVHYTNANTAEDLTVEFTKLGAGDYTVEELPTLGYKYAGDMQETSDNKNVSIPNKASEPKATVKISAVGPEATLSLTNVKNPEYFMDRDEVLNEVTFGADGIANVSITNKTESKKFATKGELIGYIETLNNKED